jgi:beta-galactosidase
MLVEPLESRCLLSFTVPADPRVVTNLDASWKFFRNEAAGPEAPSYNDANWSTVTLPHTWNAADGQDGDGNVYYRAGAWYRRHIVPSAADAGKSFYLKFDGANRITDLYVNGVFVGEHKGGYAAFGWDISQRLNVGSDNVIAVKVNNAGDPDIAPIGGDYTQFGGIYRHVNLIATNPEHVALQEYVSADTDPYNPVGPTVGYWLNGAGAYVTPTNVTSDSADLKISAVIQNDAAVSRNLTVVSDVVDGSGNLVAELSSTQTVASGAQFKFVQQTSITNPHLWNGVSDPYLYNLYVRVVDGGVTKDVLKQPFGLRSFRADAAQGAILNGQPYDLHGVNFHQDRLNKGWARSDANQIQDIGLIKEIGATMVRLSHYQHPPLTYKLLDEQGIAAWSEIPLNGTGNSGGVTNSLAFLNNAKQQLQEMIRQNYNHPAILVWGLYNELPDNGTTQADVTKLNALAHLEDPTRPTAGASIVSENAALNYMTDLVGFNKYSGWYGGSYDEVGPWLDYLHSARPSVPVGIGEYGAGASVIQHQDNPSIQDPAGPYHPEEYQGLFHEAYWKQIKARPFVWAKLVWNMFDFASDARHEGDTPGRNDKGLVTFNRKIKKDAFYFYKANWSNEPVLYITSRRFNVRTTSATTDVKIYSNLDAVTLTVNGASMGTLNSAADPDRIFKWIGVQLRGGKNLVQVTGTKNGQTYTDSVTWTLNGFAAGNGSNSPDQFYVKLSGSNIQVWMGDGTGSPTYTVDASATTAIRFNGNGGNDVLTVDYSGGNPVPSGGIIFDSGDDDDRLILKNAIGSPVTFLGGDGNKTITVDGGSFSFNSDIGAAATGTTLSLVNNAVVDCGASQHLDNVLISNGSKLDLRDNDLIVDNGNFGSLQAMVLGGYRGGPDASATGIVSTTSQTVHNGAAILALFDNSLAGIGDGVFNTGDPIGATAIAGKYTYIGDTNMDGQVTPQDYTAIDANLGTSIDLGVSWFYGDTNFDGNIDARDYAGIDGALGLGIGNPLGAGDPNDPLGQASR